MNIIAMYPGTFDPITKGHSDLIRRAAAMFSQVIVAVAASSAKQPMFSLTQRVELIQCALQDVSNVHIESFQGLSVDFAREKHVNCLVRGVRSIGDVDFELQLASMNRQLAPTIDTVFLPTKAEYAHVSASIVREIINMDGDVSAFIDDRVLAKITEINNIS